MVICQRLYESLCLNLVYVHNINIDNINVCIVLKLRMLYIITHYTSILFYLDKLVIFAHSTFSDPLLSISLVSSLSLT